jgi:hypothetical protein
LLPSCSQKVPQVLNLFLSCSYGIPKGFPKFSICSHDGPMGFPKFSILLLWSHLFQPTSDTRQAPVSHSLKISLWPW